MGQSSEQQARDLGDHSVSAVNEATVLLAPVSPEIQRRVALVIGVGAYNSVPVLQNPTRDAVGIAQALTRLGFTVHCKTDVTKTEFERELRNFLRDLEGADAGLFFYAGHGLQMNSANYLLPVDADISAEWDVGLATIKLDDVLGGMGQLCRTSLVFLDACRNNPWARALAMSAGARARGLSVRQGLAEVRARQGAYIAYATDPGDVALDGEGDNSPFTSALLRHIEAPGQTIDDLMFAVRNEVLSATNGKQLPWSHSALLSPFSFRRDKMQPADDHPWHVLRETGEADRLRRFLNDFPNDRFAGQAWGKLRQLEQDAWHKLSRRPSLVDLDRFLSIFPDGHYYRDAVAMRRRQQYVALVLAVLLSSVTGCLSSSVTFYEGPLSTYLYNPLQFTIQHPHDERSLYYFWNMGVMLFGPALFIMMRLLCQIRLIHLLTITVMTHLGWLSAHIFAQYLGSLFGLNAELSGPLRTLEDEVLNVTWGNLNYLATISVYGISSLLGAIITMMSVWLAAGRNRDFGGKSWVIGAVAFATIIWAATLTSVHLNILLLFLPWQMLFAVGLTIAVIYKPPVRLQMQA